jgi:hypothetical protein
MTYKYNWAAVPGGNKYGNLSLQTRGNSNFRKQNLVMNPEES